MNDGATVWNACSGGSTATRTGVVWTGQKFVALNTAGTIQTSTDGITWADQTVNIATVGTTGALASNGNGVIVACGASSNAYVSTNHGLTWRVVMLPADIERNGQMGANEAWSFPKYANGKFFIFPNAANVNMLVSTDGLAWVPEPIKLRGSAVAVGANMGIAYKSGTYCILTSATTSAQTATEDMSKFAIPLTVYPSSNTFTSNVSASWPSFIKARS
jgi:hypothetical protein